VRLRSLGSTPTLPATVLSARYQSHKDDRDKQNGEKKGHGTLHKLDQWSEQASDSTWPTDDHNQPNQRNG
jgi:hypothetical protein